MRDELLEFELALGLLTTEQVTEHDWGRAFLSPALPLVWDANWALIERRGMSLVEVLEAGDQALAGCAHRAIAVYDEAEGERLAAEAAATPGWEAEVNLYMTWRGGTMQSAPGPVRELALASCEDLRLELIRAEFAPEMPRLEETAQQLLERNRRYARAAGDRWFVAPADAPASACCLLERGGIGQVEDVGTLPRARDRGLGKAVVLAALAASREAGNRVTFITAAADDWPQHLYRRLGFETCGRLHVLRRAPTAGTTA